MGGIQVGESSKPKKGPKILKRLEIEPQLGGGHIVNHVYSDYAHEPKPYKFNEAGKSQGGEHVVAHLIKHAGLPATGTETAGAQPAETED